MHPLLLDILPHVRQGYCCSQLLMLLALQEQGAKQHGQNGQDADQDSPLLRAMNGLCHGLGFSGGPCGLLTGGAAVLGMWAGKDAQREALPCLVPVINDYATWFAQRTSPFGGCSCEQVATGLQGEAGQTPAETQESNSDNPPNPLLCGNLLAECWEQLRLLANDYDLDMNA